MAPALLAAAPLLLAKVWHYWLSVALLIPIGMVMLGIALGYVFKVLGSKYPKQ